MIESGNTQAQFNMVKEALLDALVKEKMMKQEVADALKENYAIVLTKRSWLGKFIDKLVFGNNDKDEFKIVVVRIVK